MVRQVLRKEIGLKIVEVDTEKATVEGGDVLWTGKCHQKIKINVYGTVFFLCSWISNLLK